jgi:hypothetical protein
MRVCSLANDSFAKAALPHVSKQSKSGMGRPRRVSFSALGKCYGTAFGKDGSEPTFAAFLLKARLPATPKKLCPSG